MPWKNKGGLTAEIAVSPAGADLATFAWRASLADVNADGPFSAFPGIDRSITLIAGDGMVLAAGAFGEARIDTPFRPFEFDGGAEVDCRLIGGAVRDFNLMVRRGLARARVDVVTAAVDLDADGSELVLYVVRGAMQASHGGLAVTALAGDSIVGRLLPGSAVRIEPDAFGALAMLATIRRSGDSR